MMNQIEIGKFIASGTTFLLAIPFMIIVDVILSKLIAEPVLDVWDMLSIFTLLILAFVSFASGKLPQSPGGGRKRY